MILTLLTGNSSLLDGINRHILNVAPILNSIENIEVQVCSIMPKGELHEELDRMGVKTYALGFPHGHALGIWGAFRRVLKASQPDIIHSHVMSIIQRLYCSYLARKVKYVETIHGISDPIEPSARYRLEKALLSISPIRINARLFISQGVKDSLIDLFNDVVITEVCYNPISFDSPKHTGKLQCLIGKDCDTKIIGTACRLSTVKNPQAFTDVMCRVLVDMPEVNAVVLGDGPENLKDECRRIVRQYNVEKRFHWLGYRPDTSKLIADMSCFVMTSHSEGMPTSLLECFVAKTPVALFEGKGGLKDIAMLNPKTHPIAAMTLAGDNSGLSKKIEKILSHTENTDVMTAKAYQIAKANFDVHNICMIMLNIYKSIYE